MKSVRKVLSNMRVLQNSIHAGVIRTPAYVYTVYVRNLETFERKMTALTFCGKAVVNSWTWARTEYAMSFSVISVFCALYCIENTTG